VQIRAARAPRILPASDCPELHDIYQRLDARHHEVQDRIRVLSAELDLLRAEAAALR
jgi:hypothetical protein